MCVLVALYDYWAVRAASGERFAWGKTDLFGYYNLLARGFVNGHLYLPVDPSPELLAQPDPWHPSVDASLKMHDVALYNGRYYLYYGVVPAVLLFVPYRLLTGHDLPQNFAVLLLSVGGFLLFAAALLGLLRRAGATPGPFVTALLILGLGVCQGMPFLLNRIDVYETAIACGYFCTAAGVYCLLRGLDEHATPVWLAAAGIAFGFAAGSRPHLLFAGLAAAATLAFTRWRLHLPPYAVGLAATGLGLAAYNYARFGNPLEFGLRYHLGGPGQNRIELAAANWLPGIYYFLLAPPDLGPVFPWIRLWYRFPFDNGNAHPLPPGYFLEPITGALWHAPLVVFALFAPWLLKNGPRYVAETAAAAGLAVLAFLISNHFTTHRYQVDFLPLLVFTALAALAVLAARSRLASLLLFALVTYSAFANIALGIGGPYFDMLKNRPRNYVRLATRFSPTAETTPLYNPAIHVRFQVTFTPKRPGYREPLLTIGHSHHVYYLYADRPDDNLQLFSHYNGQTLEHHTSRLPGSGPHTFEFTYSPERSQVTILWNGTTVFTHDVPLLVTAPAGVTIGQNHSDSGVTNLRFPGTVTLLERTVAPTALAIPHRLQ